ncbi:MAG: hypothetical protein P8R46_09105 [Planctomycetota bacterium]|nr:hypothetical protein [Planctomycetota bacterium]
MLNQRSRPLAATVFAATVFAAPVFAATVFAATAFAAPVGAQVTLDLQIRSGGAPVVSVMPGEVVSFSVEAQLGGDPSQGLAMFSVDLDHDGGPLSPVLPSAAAAPFDSPMGLTNPAGFGGTLRGGALLQVGGAMNTINNQFAAAPLGAVVTGVALTVPEVLATGSLVAPSSAGVYTVSARNLFANALDAPAPAGHWEVLPVEPGAIEPLTLLVLECGAQTFCEAKVDSAGCAPSITSSGAASLGGSSSLTLTASNVLNGQYGLFVYGTEVADDPAFGGKLCVGGSVVRLFEPTNSGGSGAPGTSCSGSFTRVIDGAALAAAGFGIGDEFFCQWLYRDPLAPDGSGAGITNAAAFLICP